MTNINNRLNWDQIQPNLFVGSCLFLRSDVNIVCSKVNPDVFMSLQTTVCHKSQGINHAKIVDQVRSLNREYMWCPILDFNPEDQRRKLPQAVKMLDAALKQGTVYLFCTAGINRSTMVALAHMVFVQGETLDDALTLIQEKRPKAYPYIDVLLQCRNAITQKYHKRIEEEAYRNYCAGEYDEIRNWFKAEKKVIRDIILQSPTTRSGLIAIT